MERGKRKFKNDNEMLEFNFTLHPDTDEDELDIDADLKELEEDNERNALVNCIAQIDGDFETYHYIPREKIQVSDDTLPLDVTDGGSYCVDKSDDTIVSGVTTGNSKDQHQPLVGFKFLNEDQTGVQTKFPTDPKPIDIFKHFFDKELLTVICNETNKYARLIMENSANDPKKHSRVNQWKDTTVMELKVFFGLIILMSITRKPNIELYFSKHYLHYTPIFGQAISLNRFQLLMSFLHFSSEESDFRLHLLNSVSDPLKEKFKSSYTPKRNICVYESCMSWKGHATYGIRGYELCDSATGYIWNYLIYTGAQTEVGKDKDKNFGEKVVLTLLADELRNKGYIVYTNRFFTSPNLAKCLSSLKTSLCDTVQSNRKNMPLYFQLNAKQMNTNVKQKRNAKIMTTYHSTEMETVSGKRKRNDNKSEDTMLQPRTDDNKLKDKLECVLRYNDSMEGTDQEDGQRQHYPSMRKTIKWHKKYFFYVMDMAIYNSLVIFTELTGKKPALLDFRSDIAESLLSFKEAEVLTKKVGRSSPHDYPFRLIERHFPHPIAKDGSKKKLRRDCRVCLHTAVGKPKRKQTHYMCIICDVALCVYPCFEVFHTKSNY